MHKLLIITRFDYYNYGQKLQNYAVQELVRREGLEPFTYVEINPNRRRRPHWKRLAKYLIAPFVRGKDTRLMRKRARRFRQFVGERMSVAELSRAQLFESMGRDYDVYLTGSDQIWTYFDYPKKAMERNFLRFAPRHKRVCFAPSFGFDEEPESLREIYTEGLMGFDMLSCRERSGCDIIRRLTGREAELLCDPSMMLPVEQWDAFARPPRSALPEHYLVYYFLSTASEDLEERIERFAREQKLAIVKLRHVDQPQYYDTTPDEFVYIMKRAEYVFTDSFHGCVFSILYHRSFAVFARQGRAFSEMFGRIETLLETFGLEACANPDQMGAPVDYSGADAILAEQREKGIHYLHAALERALSGEKRMPS